MEHDYKSVKPVNAKPHQNIRLCSLCHYANMRESKANAYSVNFKIDNHSNQKMADNF
jgi:hypothetical protein